MWRSDNLLSLAVASALLGAVALTGAANAQAGGMERISDEELGEVTGQAVLGYDVIETAEADFTRFTMGMEMEVQTNINSIAYGTDADGVSDVGMEHFSLGHIARTDGVQLDGQNYSANEIVPFVGLDPYFELAEKDGDIQGFRFGFSEARGTLSGDISTLSGQIGMELEDDGEIYQGQMLREDGTENTHRATHFGLEGEGTDCSSGVRCTSLSNLQTLEIGSRNEDGTAGFTNDFFLSFQKQDTEWALPGTPGETISTQAGVFFNLPTAMRMDLQQLETQGAPRARTEHIDRGMGLF